MKAISRALTPQKPMPPRFLKENFDPNTMPLPSDSGSSQLRSMPFGTKTRSPLPPKPPIHPSSLNHGGNPLKRKLNLETDSNSSDSGVQVVVRMRPLNNEEESSQIVQKVLPNSVSILDHTFTFDAVADTRSTQLDIFKLVGIPLVENCLAGFNSSIFAYGQTGSGKTYTMWGPPSALSAKHKLSEERGLTPRVFERLFSRLAEEQAKHSDKQLSYQCRCSFLEIYNEHITDLLDPTQKNLQIREDVKTGIYVDYLTEENVCTMKDVVQLLDKGLAHRRTGETSINAESSRSHCVFTCVVESRSKRVTDGLSNIRISRINLVDLAGSESQRKTGAAGERLKEAGNINRSLSQLGNLINILAEVSQSGKTRHIPYRDSRLTFLLQESLGGNAKLAMICAISPSQSCKSETFSTLRFAYRAKAIKNKAVVNEVTQDDVNVLREQIRQLKDELLRMKSTGTSSESNRSYSTGWNARRSLNILKMSLNCPRLLPVAEEDDDEEMEIDNDDVEKAPLNMEVQSSRSNNESDQVSEVRHSSETSQKGEKTAREGPKVQKIATEQAASADSVVEEIVLSNEVKGTMILAKMMSPNKSSTIKCTQANTSVSSSENMLIEEKSNKDSPCQKSPVLHSPTLSISPLFETSCKRSLRKSSSISASKGNISINAKSSSRELRLSFADNLKRSKNSLLRPEDLEASLHRGLQIIDSHRQSLSLRQSTFSFSIKPVDLIPSMPVVKVDVGMQTLPQELELSGDLSAYICSYCKNRPPPLEYDDNTNYEKELKLVPIEGSKVADKCKTRIPKTVEKVLSGAVRREMALEDHCAQQAAEIMQLNRLIQQHKHERECRAVIEQTQGDKISRLESLMDGILPTEDFLEEEFTALTNEHKFLKEKYENHPEVLRLNIELKRAQDELEGYRNFCAMGERDVLMEEIQDLKCHLQYYTDPSSLSTLNRIPLIHSIRSTELCLDPLSTIPDSTEESSDDKKEEEDRCHWAETESKWISLCEELRSELEANRSLAEKTKLELETEKKCAEELKEALQTAMHGHARILEQYADLQEKHIALLGRHRMMTDGIEDVTKAAAKAGIKGSESKFVKSLAAEISALKSEREKERRYWRDENKGLQAQLRDTAEAVQAAGELLVRLKEAEEATANAQKRTLKAELEIEKAYEEIDSLKKHYEQQIELLNQLLADSNLPKEAPQPTFTNAGTANFDPRECSTDKKWREELESFEQGDGEFSRGTEPHSWFSDYDRCNI